MAEPDTGKPQGVGVKIDGTINVNTLITAGMLLVSGALAYATLDKRITILEQLAIERSTRVEERLRELQQDVKNLAQVVNANSQTIRKQPDKQ